jgi:hypothetical protein
MGRGPGTKDKGLSGFGDFASFDTLRADSDVANCPGNDGTDPLQVWIESPLCPVIGVTDPVPRQCSFAADVTTICHDSYSSCIVSI